MSYLHEKRIEGTKVKCISVNMHRPAKRCHILPKIEFTCVSSEGIKSPKNVHYLRSILQIEPQNKTFKWVVGRSQADGVRFQRILAERIYICFNSNFTWNLVDLVNHLENYLVGRRIIQMCYKYLAFLAAAASAYFLPAHICLLFLSIYSRKILFNLHQRMNAKRILY